MATPIKAWLKLKYVDEPFDVLKAWGNWDAHQINESQ